MSRRKDSTSEDTSATSRKQDLLNAIQAFPAGNVYLVAPRDYVSRGYEYYRQGRVISLAWSKDHACLTAKVLGTHTYAVNIIKRRDNLFFSCSCPAWTDETNCKHVVCTLLTIKNLLQPELFNVPDRTRPNKAALLSSLTGNAPELRAAEDAQKGYTIVIENKGFFQDIHVELDGNSIGDERLYLFPHELRPLATRLPSILANQKLVDLAYYLNRYQNRYPIVVETNGRRWNATFDPDAVYSCRTLFDILGDSVKVSPVCIRAGDIEQNMVVFGMFAFNLETGVLGLVEDGSGWELFNSIIETYRPEHSDDTSPVSIPAEDVNRYLQISLPADGNSDKVATIFAVNGEVSTLASTEFGYELRIEPAQEEGMFLLFPVCRSGSSTTPTFHLLSQFFIELYQLSGPLRAKKRRDVLVRTFLDMMSTPSRSKAEKMAREALKQADLPQRRYVREAVEFLLGYFDMMRLDIEQVLVQEGRWAKARIDFGRQALLYRIPYEIFGMEVFNGPFYQADMCVSMEALTAALPILEQRLRVEGMGLFIKGKPVRQANWDIEVTAVSSGEIDWFELRPEIKCDGKLINIRGLGKGYVEREDCIEVLDSKLSEAIRQIEMLSSSGSSRKGRELVRVPRLMILDWISLRSKGVKVRLQPEDENIVGRLLNFERIDKKAVPEKLNAKLRPYQLDGYNWLAFLYEHRFGACLADDMGLGKTLQAISLLGGIQEGIVCSPLKPEKRLHLIVVPPSLLFNWEHEISRFYPDLKVMTYIGTDRMPDFEHHDAVLTTYGILRRDIEMLEKIPFDVVIFDEAQTVKNIHAGMTSAARRLKAYFKLVMTGTPLENHIGEYYSIIDLALPGLLGDYDKFRAMSKKEVSPDMQVLLRRTRPFVLRRTKDNVLSDLPPKTETDVYLDLTEEQKALYTRTVEEVRGTINEAYREKTQAQAKIIALAAILKLRQICVSPALVEPKIKAGSPKAEFLIESLGEILNEGHSALVFSQFTSFLDIIEPELQAAGIEYLRLDGSTPVGKRKTMVREFQSGEGPSVFLLSLKAGGKGLNLTRATYVYHLDPWWNPAVEDQASDRAHRIGQKKSVTITRILMRHTIEEKMMELKKRKVELYKAVMEGAEQKGRGFAITKEDFEYLLA